MKIPKTIRIHVSKKNIKYGKPQALNFCPIALAVKSKLHAKDVDVTDDEITLNAARFKGATYRLPAIASAFIDKFDFYGRKAVKPFTFTAKLYYID